MDTHAILYRNQDGTLHLGAPHKTPECAALGVSPFEGAEVLGTVSLLPEPVSGMHYRLAAQPPKAEVSAVEVFRIAGGDTECCPNPTAEVALDCLRDLRARYDEAITATPTAAADSEDAKALKRVDAILREFEGMTGAGYKYMAANIRAAIKGPDAARNQESQG